MSDIDLEALAAGYHHRRFSPGDEARAAEAADHARLGAHSTAVDVGGGRGDHAEVFARRGALAVVVDPSRGMAEAAAARVGVHPVVGTAQHLPLADGSVDLVYFHLSIHYGDWRASLAEAGRVCREGGSLWVWTFGPDHFPASFLGQWFPSIPAIDERRFADPDLMAAHLRAEGWEGIRRGSALERVERTAGEWRRAVEGGFVSTLQMVPPGEVEDGLRRFSEAHPDPDETVTSTLAFRSLAARRPSLPWGSRRGT